MVLDLVADIQTLVDGFKSFGECLRTELYAIACGVLESSAALAGMTVVEVIDQNG